MHVCLYPFLFLAGWNVDVMAGALAANLDCETKTEGAYDLCDHEAIPAWDCLPLNFI